ncbi:hypothetical protein ACX27_21970 [Nostoc piscinale CENA21]|uniref:PEP-CTERM sorting domain-containing protein n=1 Tax=Nostoc piscinale CENA21 TaxID=224013 RepID=A0A0M5TIL6_9NOSO|nr:hypothetical protein [Nostoc piscinale]ALF54888.1 hypothetical protein ACX27_21970 [Nostoc piscinale CENA21]
MKALTQTKIVSAIASGVAALAATATFSLTSPSPVKAATVTPGLAFSVSSGPDPNGYGVYFSSSTNNPFGNPLGKNEVGNYYNEDIRGLSEYNLAGLSTTSLATVSFNVFQAGGLFSGQNDFPFTGNIKVLSYIGNNAENLYDYQAPSIGTVRTFSTANLAVGDTLSFDVTSIFNNAISNGFSSLGFRLQVDDGTNPDGGALTFDNFRLTTVPEPNFTSALLVVIFGSGVFLKTRIKQS